MLASIPLIGGAVAALFVVAIIPWILGVPGDPGPPGHESNYARGWKMGLGVIIAYPLVWALNFLSYFIFRGFVSPAAQTSWQNISQWVGVVALIAAILRLVWAFRVLSRS